MDLMCRKAAKPVTKGLGARGSGGGPSSSSSTSTTSLVDLLLPVALCLPQDGLRRGGGLAAVAIIDGDDRPCGWNKQAHVLKGWAPTVTQPGNTEGDV